MTHPSPETSAASHPWAVARKVTWHPTAVTAGALCEWRQSGAIPGEMPRLPTRVARLDGAAISRQVSRHQAVVAHSFGWAV